MVRYVGSDCRMIEFSFEEIRQSILRREDLEEKTRFSEVAHICDNGSKVTVVGMQGKVFGLDTPNTAIELNQTFGKMDWTSVASHSDSVVVAGYRDKSLITYVLLDSKTSEVQHFYSVCENVNRPVKNLIIAVLGRRNLAIGSRQMRDIDVIEIIGGRLHALSASVGVRASDENISSIVFDARGKQLLVSGCASFRFVRISVT